MKQNLQRIRLFCTLVGKQSPHKQRIGIRQAWRVAGISTGKIVAMPDEMIAWWWKIQDVATYDLKRKKQSAASGR